MDLAVRVNVRYAAPPDSQLKDVMRLFKSARWVRSVLRHILPQLRRSTPISVTELERLRQSAEVITDPSQSCAVCLESVAGGLSMELACHHRFHVECIERWLRVRSTCPCCRSQLPTEEHAKYSISSINTTILLPKDQSQLPPHELANLSTTGLTIRAVVNAKVRRDERQSEDTSVGEHETIPSLHSGDRQHDLVQLQARAPEVMTTTVETGGNASESSPVCVQVPTVPLFQRHLTRRRNRECSGSDVERENESNKRRRGNAPSQMLQVKEQDRSPATATTL